MSKSEAERHKKKKGKRSNTSANKREKWWRTILAVGRFVRVLIGGLSLYALVASLFFLFSWEHDLMVVAGLDWDQFRHAYPNSAANPLGILGAWLSYWVVYRGFGIMGLLLPILGIWWGWGGARPRPLFWRWGRHMVVITLVVSPLLAIIFGSQYPLAGGLVGFQMQWWLRGVLGVVGLWLTALLFIIFYGGWARPLAKGVQKILSWSGQRLKERRGKTDPLISEPPLHSEEASEASVSPTGSQKDATASAQQPAFEKSESTTDGKPALEQLEDPPSGEVPMEVVTSQASIESHVTDLKVVSEPYDETAELPDYRFPVLDLLKDYPAPPAEQVQADLEKGKGDIVRTLAQYGIEIERIRATVGPTVTLYEIVPKSGIRVRKIQSLEDDIALNLAAHGIRIIAPIPGRGTIGIEVPNETPRIVGLKSVLADPAFVHSQSELPLALGRTIDNQAFVVDLARMPHLLIAGATGQGKSVGINVIIASLLFKKHPAQVKFVFVDPKKVELALYSGLDQHFLAHLPGAEEPILTETSEVLGALNSLTQIMDHRYALLKSAKVRSIKEYNQKFVQRILNPDEGHHYMPYIVLVVDEFADLIMTAGKEIEQPIGRLAQLARAVGIHLILATQRPSVNIITGVIKANFPVRIAFRVSSRVDSRTIIDGSGAERLVGRGDMLYFNGSSPTRLQCAFIDTDEVERVVNFIAQQPGFQHQFSLPEPQLDEDMNKSVELGDIDPLLYNVAEFVVFSQQVSASLIQRRFKVGYNRAARIVEELEALQIISPPAHNNKREVLVGDVAHLKQLFNQT